MRLQKYPLREVANLYIIFRRFSDRITGYKLSI